MRSLLRFCFLVVVCSIFAGIQPSAAQSFSFPVNGFTTNNVCANSATPPPACQVLTNGSPSQPQVVNNGVLRLTTANTNQHGSAWFHMQQPLASGFTTAFQFQISNTNSCFFCGFPADGLALVIQADPAGTGAIGYTGNGQNMAYGDNDIATASGPGNAILNSLAIELDTHQNSDYDDPDGNHIAVQSCGPNTPSALSANSADHNYICPNGNLAKIALQSLPQGMSLTDGLTHTITVNYLPPGNCTSACNNLSVYFDSTLILQATVNIAQQLNLTSGTSAYIGFTAATGALVENNDIVSWSFSQWPLSPITINQPLQPTVTNFNYTSTLSAITDYSQSGLGSSQFQGVFMQGTVQAITDAQFNTLVSNTPFQGSTCQHQDTGNGNYSCVVTTDLCTTPTNSVAAGANCLTTTNPVIVVSNTYNLDPSQKPLIGPNYIMGKDTALNCLSTDDNTCKGLVSIFTGINGDIITSSGGTKNFNSILIPIIGAVSPDTSITTSPQLNSGWINGPVTLTFNSVDTVPSNNKNPPSSLPTVTSINYSVSGANVSSPASGTINGSTGSISIPGAVEGTTTITYSGIDSAGTTETVVTNSGNNVSTSTPTFTYSVDLTKPTVTCTSPAATWQATDVSVPCTASDNAGGSGLVGPSSFNVQTNVPTGTETNNATIPAVTVQDVAGNVSLPQPAQGSFGPFEVDKKAPVIIASVSPTSPTYGQTVTGSYECTDGGSGVVLCGPSGTAKIQPTPDTGTLTSVLDNSVGTHTFTVNAQDQVGNNSVASSVTYTVSKATTTTSIKSVSPNPGLPNSPIVISYSVVGSTNLTSPTGNVTVTASTGEFCTGTVTAGSCSIMFATTGTRTVTASYAGDSNFSGSSSTTSVQVNVGDFSITATPATETISSGHTATYTISVTPIGGLTGTVALSCSGGPAGSTCSVSPSTDNLQGGTVSSTVTLTPSKNVAHGTWTLTFTGNYGNGALVHSYSVTLTVKGNN